MRRRIAAIAVASLALGVCGCSPAERLNRASTAESDVPAAPSPLARGAQEEPLEAEATEPSPTHDDVSDAEALAVASAALTAYLRHDLPRRAWLSGLEPHLTPAAIVRLSSVDPSAVVPTSVSGPIVLERDASGYLARATAQTGAGAYVLLLGRETSGQWLVSEILQPEVGSP